YISDRIAIMYLGKIVELGNIEDVISNPYHPYSKALISAVPVPNPKRRGKEIPIRGEVPTSPIDVPPGCRFHPRCPYAMEVCRKEEPVPKELSRGHYVACHLYS
ncbi:MAG: oligopeptide ABC transporter ATP-binding protein, partial [Thermoprotei archaeon]